MKTHYFLDPYNAEEIAYKLHFITHITETTGLRTLCMYHSNIDLLIATNKKRVTCKLCIKHLARLEKDE